MSNSRIRVEVVYALPLAQDVCSLEVEDSVVVGEAIALSGVTRRHPEIDLGGHRFSVFGRLVTLKTRLRHGDRLEILRPLSGDPKERRRLRGQRAGS